MRLVFAVLFAAMSATPVLAQPLPPQPAPPAVGSPPGTAPPGWVPPGANPQTGARPGNDIGTGMSMPLSNRAGNIGPQDTRSPIASRLPDPAVEDNAAISAYLSAAQNALAAGRTGEAQEALERAETRALDRSVPLFQTSTPSGDPLVAQINQALQLLGARDRMGAMQAVQQALTEAQKAPPTR